MTTPKKEKANFGIGKFVWTVLFYISYPFVTVFSFAFTLLIAFFQVFQ